MLPAVCALQHAVKIGSSPILAGPNSIALVSVQLEVLPKVAAVAAGMAGVDTHACRLSGVGLEACIACHRCNIAPLSYNKARIRASCIFINQLAPNRNLLFLTAASPG